MVNSVERLGISGVYDATTIFGRRPAQSFMAGTPKKTTSNSEIFLNPDQRAKTLKPVEIRERVYRLSVRSLVESMIG